MAKVNKLNAGIIKQAYSKEFTKKKLTVLIDNKSYEILIDEKFKTTKLNEMVLEVLKNYENYEKLPDNLRLTYIYFIMIKYFTDLDVTTETFEEQLALIEALIDLNIFETIIASFVETEINKLVEYMKKFTERLVELMKENKSAEDIVSEIESEINEDLQEKTN